MSRFRRALPVPVVLALAASVAGVGTASAQEAPPPHLDVEGTFDNGGEGTAEIVAWDRAYQQAYVVDAANTALLVLDLSDPANPREVTTVDFTPLAPGGINSVAVRPGDATAEPPVPSLVAVAGESADAQDPGVVVFHDEAANVFATVTVGANPADDSAGSRPDSVAFTPDGNHLVVANEGEPVEVEGVGTVDPEGVITVIDVTGDPADLGPADVTDIGFRAFNAGQSRDLRLATASGLDGFAFDPSVPSLSADIEPEFVAVSPDSTRAFVTLQEVNGIAIVDIVNGAILDVVPAGYVDHSVDGNGLDPSDRDGVVDVRTVPLMGVRQPDAIDAFEVDGTLYFATANEGDDRDDDVRVGDLVLDDNLAGVDADDQLGRIAINPNLTRADGPGDTDDDDLVDTLFSYGTRGFTIFDATGAVVFDSGDAFEQLLAADPAFAAAFNADDPVGLDAGELVPDVDDRSDDRGPEPEEIEFGVVDGVPHLFVGLERMGGIVVYDVSDPADARLVTYLSTRNLSDHRFGVRDFDGDGALSEGDLVDAETTGGDVSPEGIDFVAAADAPTGVPMLLVAHEVSGTVTAINVRAAVAAPPAAATPTPDDPGPEGDAPAAIARLAGDDRFATAVAVSGAAFPDGVDTVVLARGDDYADAVTGAALAADRGGPLLLTRTDEVPQATLDEIERLGASDVLLLGGTSAISQDVFNRVQGLESVMATRIAGADRFETAARIADELVAGATDDTVFLVEGIDEDPRRGWPDAVAVGAYAGFLGAPILLASTDELPAATATALGDLAPSEVVVVGGEMAVSAAVVAAVEAIVGEGNVRRIAGDDRYATSAAVHAEAVANGLGTADRWLATGTAFPDALAAGAAAGATGQSLLLVPPTVDDATRSVLSSSFEYAELFALVGGPAAIPIDVEVAVGLIATGAASTNDFCLTVLHNNDGESQLVDAGSGLEDFGGAARFATRLLMERARGMAPDGGCTTSGVLTVTSGDNFLAGPEFNASRANSETTGGPLFDSVLHDYLDYDAIDLGNHDFDFGPGIAADFVGGVSADDDVVFLSANLDPSAEPALAAHVNSGRLAPSTVVDVAGRNVGVIGLTTPTIEFISSPGNVRVAGLDGLDTDVEVLAGFVEAEVANVRAQGADVIVLISHLQGVDEDLALAGALTDVDIVVAGGGDEILASPGDLLVPGDEAEIFGPYPLIATDADGAEVPVVTTAGSYRYVGRLDVRFDDAGDLTVVDATSRMVRVSGGDLVDAVAPDPFVQATIVDPVVAFLEGLAGDVIATSEVDLDGRRSSVRTQQTNEGALLADALVAAAAGNAAAFGLDTDAAFVGLQNGGGIRNDAVIPAGDITTLDTFDIAPFSNFVTVFEDVSLEELDAMLEHAYTDAPSSAGKFAQLSNLVVDVSVDGVEGDRVSIVSLGDGSPFPEAGVSLVTIDFLARGGDGYPTDALGPFTSVGVSYQQALADHVAALGTITADDYPEITTEGDPPAGNADRIRYVAG